MHTLRMKVHRECNSKSQHDIFQVNATPSELMPCPGGAAMTTACMTTAQYDATCVNSLTTAFSSPKPSTTLDYDLVVLVWWYLELNKDSWRVLAASCD